MPLLALVLGAGWWIKQSGWIDGEWTEFSRQFPVCGSGTRGSGCVIDGDTIAIGNRRIRLTGYDAPELNGACEAERVKAREARAELSRWLSSAPFEMEAGDDRPYDQYGRELREARRGGELLAEHMHAMGLAEQDLWGFDSDWGHTDWCAES
ncbi:thermonuclease family protein [Aurantiacibacter sp. D1-12]|uniref:thermonuclease family protein n=1 Tax=Aurantiacibacter sp. D1-12 TaxID=2993658 RepID=UPI00237CFCD1|nr:thermonuclease family protein [Aurantiacibacter sp. D1-12]MDE1467326.1 thermonuclease family protein [Aurantiacibacter sp. D1-12]